MVPEEDCILFAETMNAAVRIPTKRFFVGLKTSEKDGQNYSEKPQYHHKRTTYT